MKRKNTIYNYLVGTSASILLILAICTHIQEHNWMTYIMLIPSSAILAYKIRDIKRIGFMKAIVYHPKQLYENTATVGSTPPCEDSIEIHPSDDPIRDEPGDHVQ